MCLITVSVASPGPDCYSKVLSPISVNTPSDRLLLPDHSSQQFNLRHVPATWDLNEAGDVDRGAVVSEGGATLGLKTLSGFVLSVSINIIFMHHAFFKQSKN